MVKSLWFNNRAREGPGTTDHADTASQVAGNTEVEYGMVAQCPWLSIKAWSPREVGQEGSQISIQSYSSFLFPTSPSARMNTDYFKLTN